MEIHGWGRYPWVNAEVGFPQSLPDFYEAVKREHPLIARGLGRSYGDSSLADHVLETRFYSRFQAFDEASGLLTCDAGVSLAEILDVFVPKGWFLPVTPGTRFVTVGGAIASDVHGKNHHVDGTFGQHVTEIRMIRGNGETVTASPSENADLFYATCGGMGLTGVIVSATIRLKPIKSSLINETTIKAPDLEAVLNAFEENKGATYSVAWIDCLAKGNALGRSLLMLGEHAESGELEVPKAKAITVPFDMPTALMNHGTIQAFNTLYYNRVRLPKITRTTCYEPFFYPLDKLSQWNRLYGKPGFTQYQFVLPKEVGLRGMRSILERIAASGRGSFLAVLKAFGKANQNLLSFPLEGYTLALDFKAEPAVFDLLNELDKLVLDYGGRLYLTKDARMSEDTFKSSYPNWQEFEAVRGRYHALGKFASRQSLRLGLK
jgi:decaprenylphospho-beta-D-ribofuranose 2-oxidase